MLPFILLDIIALYRVQFIPFIIPIISSKQIYTIPYAYYAARGIRGLETRLHWFKLLSNISQLVSIVLEFMLLNPPTTSNLLPVMAAAAASLLAFNMSRADNHWSIAGL